MLVLGCCSCQSPVNTTEGSEQHGGSEEEMATVSSVEPGLLGLPSSAKREGAEYSRFYEEGGDPGEGRVEVAKHRFVWSE